MAALETYTIAEAAELTGLSKKAMRHRVDRGQLHAIKDGHLRRISRAELERAGLRVTAEDLARDDTFAAIRGRLAEREHELSQARSRLEAERALRIEAEASAKRAWAARAAERDWRDELLTVDPVERRRLVREALEDAPEEVFFSRFDSPPADDNGQPAPRSVARNLSQNQAARRGGPDPGCQASHASGVDAEHRRASGWGA